MLAGTKRCHRLFGMKRSRCEQRYGIDVPVIQHIFQTACRCFCAGFRLPLFKRCSIAIAEAGQSAMGMTSKSVHPRPAEPETDHRDIEFGHMECHSCL
jgi:hypothetical protein